MIRPSSQRARKALDKYRELLLSFYRDMYRIRCAEEKLIEVYATGEIRSLMHLSTGQEAVAVGVCHNLDRVDSVVSTHRCHAHYLAKGGDLKKMFAELAGKVTGCAQGRGGSMHLFDLDVGMNLSVPLVGGSIPIGVGYALSFKHKNEPKVSVVFFGDGAVEEGVFWESLNFAVVRKLPVVFVCENNLYATHAHILKRQPFVDIAPRIASQGVYSSLAVDGNNVFRVYRAAKKMIKAARSGLGPCFLEAKTYRFKEHWGPNEDWKLGYRSREELEEWKKKCPIERIKEVILNLGNKKTAGILAEIEEKIKAEVEEAVKFAIESKFPEEQELYG